MRVESSRGAASPDSPEEWSNRSTLHRRNIQSVRLRDKDAHFQNVAIWNVEGPEYRMVCSLGMMTLNRSASVQPFITGIS